MIRTIRQNKGTVLYSIIVAIAMIMLALLMFIVLHPAMTTMFSVAESQFNMTNATGYQGLKATWWLVPVAVGVGALIYIFINSQKKEYMPVRY